MPINTKVKKTGYFFEATNEEHLSGNVHVLEKANHTPDFYTKVILKERVRIAI